MGFFKNHPMVFGNRYMRCLVTFGIMQFFMGLFFIINSIALLCYFDETSKYTATGLEVLWDYFPLIALYIFWREEWQVQKTYAKLSLVRFTPVQKRFLIWNAWALALLIPVSILKVYWRFNCPNCSGYWWSLLLLEWIWIYIQAIGPLFWMIDNWTNQTKEHGNPNGKTWYARLSHEQRCCIAYYIVPLIGVMISAYLYRVSESINPYGFSTRLFSVIEDFFFVLGPIMSSLRWIKTEQRRQAFDDKLEELHQQHVQ